MRNISTFLSSLHAALLSTTKGKKKKRHQKSQTEDVWMLHMLEKVITSGHSSEHSKRGLC